MTEWPQPMWPPGSMVPQPNVAYAGTISVEPNYESRLEIVATIDGITSAGTALTLDDDEAMSICVKIAASIALRHRAKASTSAETTADEFAKSIIADAKDLIEKELQKTAILDFIKMHK